MKKSNLIKIIFALAIAVSIAAIPSQILGAGEKTKKAEGSEAFENTPAWNKVGPTLRELWLAAKKSGDLSQKVECFVVVRSPGSAGDQSLLFGAGYSTQILSGAIARGHMELRALPQVANLYFVRKINLANKAD